MLSVLLACCYSICCCHCFLFILFLVFFFFQAEDGIRDYKVTGVQTCALPIWPTGGRDGERGRDARLPVPQGQAGSRATRRSEERRVGKECRSRWSPDE